MIRLRGARRAWGRKAKAPPGEKRQRKQPHRRGLCKRRTGQTRGAAWFVLRKRLPRRRFRRALRVWRSEFLTIGDCDEMTDGVARTEPDERASQHGPNRREHRQCPSPSGDRHCPSGLRELVVACGFDPPAGGSQDGSLIGVADLEDSRTRFIRGGRPGVPARGQCTAGVTRRYVWGAHGAERRTRT